MTTKDRIIKYLEPIKFDKTDGKKSGDLNVGVVLDTETTGLGKDAEIIEFAALPFFFTDDLEIVKVWSPFTCYGEPIFTEITKEVTNITGITPETVKGHKLDKPRIERLIKSADIVIAHNAKFDRRILEQNIPNLKKYDTTWVCSAFDPKYADYSVISSNVLDYVLFRFGYWFEHHRAENDCFAVLRILLDNYPGTDINVFKDVITRVYNPDSVKLFAKNSPFDEKEILKNNGYFWDGGVKSWFKKININQQEQEISWLKENLSRVDPIIDQEDIYERYKS